MNNEYRFITSKQYKIVFLLAFLCNISINTFAQGKIEGVVISKTDSKPVSGAHVVTGRLLKATDSNGSFVLDGIESGDVMLTVSAIGFITQELNVKVAQNGIATVVVELIQDNIFIDEVVISATRSESRIGEIPGRVEIITMEKLILSSYQSVDELLSLLPGVHTARSFGLFSFRSTVSMRGVSSKEQARTLVLLDGVPVNKADGGSVNWNLISTGEIERIEVIKGPGSALYGGNAMGGIINIVSKKPKETVEGSISATYGTYNTKGVDAKFSGRLRKGFYWSGNGLFRNSDGYITQSYADQLANQYITESTFEERVLNFKTGYQKNESFSAEVDFTLFDDVRTTGEQVFQPLGNTREYDTYQIRSVLKGTVGKVQWNASAFFQREFYKRVSEWMRDDYTWYDVLSVRSDYGILTNANYTLKNHVFTAGVDVRLGEVDASDIYYTSTDKVDNRGKMDFYGFYVQDEVAFMEGKLKFVAGLRYDMARFYDGAFVIHSPSSETNFMDQYQFADQEDFSWGAFSPRLSLQFKPNDMFRIYTSYSRGFRPSVLDDLCRSGRVRGGFKVANPNLEPEYLSNIELGGDIKPLKWLRIAASTYYSKGKDFLYYVSTGDSIDMGFGPRPIMIRDNISEVEIYGFETDFSANPLRFLSLFGSYAFASSKIVGYQPIDPDDFDLTGKYLTDVPKHSFALGAYMRTRIVNAGITSKYTGEVYINDHNVWDDIVLSDQLPASYTVDLKFSKEIFRHVNLSLNIQNIFDRKIYESSLSVGPGRFIMFEVEAKL